MKKRTIFLTIFAGIFSGVAQENSQVAQQATPLLPFEQKQEKKQKSSSFALDGLLRAGLVSDSYKNMSGQDGTYLRLDEARLNFQGNISDDLAFRVRLRTNRALTPNSLENSSASLDHFYLEYNFGQNRNWSVTVGKQMSIMGSYELITNPIYEYAYTDYVNNTIASLFVMGAKISYKANENHAFSLMLHNTVHNNFTTHLTNGGLSAGDFKASKLPMGAYVAWSGNFLDKKLQTQWSYNIAQFAQDELSHTFSLGNQYKTDKQWIYLDLMYSKMGADFPMIVSQTAGAISGNNVLVSNTSYKAAVLRFEQHLAEKWEIGLKGAVETSGNADLGHNFRKNYTYFVALQHKPIQNQDLKFYLGYVGNTIMYESVLPTERLSRVAVGALYNIPMWRK